MLPVLAMRALGIVEEEDMVVPGLQIPRAMGGPRLAGVPAIAELRVVALAAAGAGDPQHLLLPGPVAAAMVVELAALLEAIEGVAAVQLMLLVLGHGVGEGPAAGGHGLEALIAPAAIDIEVADRGAADEGAAVGGHVHDAAPMAQQAQARDAGHHGDGAFGDRLHLRELATLGIGVEAVDMAAEDEAAFVRLREVEELRPEG